MDESEKSFQAVKQSVLTNACHGGDPDRQYHLVCDASGFAYRGVLFQLADDQPIGTVMSSKLAGSMSIIQFISKKFLDAETRYHTMNREALAIVRCLEETRWLVNENRHPVLIYTDHKCLKTALQNSDKGRIVGWQLRLSEYDFRIIHIKGKENALADGMSRLLIDALDFGKPGKEESALEIMDAKSVIPTVLTTNSVAFTAPSTTNLVAFAALLTTNLVAFAAPSKTNSVAFARPPTNSVAFTASPIPSVETDVSAMISEEVEIAKKSKGGMEEKWEYWLADEWYAGVVYLKLYGKLREKDAGEDSLMVWRWWIRKVAAYQLIDEPNDYPLLAYTEHNG